MTTSAPAGRSAAKRRRLAGPLLPGLTLLLGFPLAACSGGGGSQGSSPGSKASLEILSCSLGCAPVGDSISCGPLNISVNEEIAVEFSDSIDLESVDKNSFRVVEAGTGAVPSALFRLDPTNPRRLLYRPALTFDSQGNPIFGLRAGSTYRLTIPGLDEATGSSQSFIRSVSGRRNAVQLECTLSATEGVVDLGEGPPRVDVFLDVVQPSGIVEHEVLANETEETQLEDVYQDTEIKLVFDDVMNPATVVNPVTGLSTLIDVVIDVDGDASDDSDQVELPGTFTISLDQLEFRTTVTFTPTAGLPSGVVGSSNRLLVVHLPPGIEDLGGNSLENGGSVTAIPEPLTFTVGQLPPGGETFTGTDHRDEKRTGAVWGPLFDGAQVGALRPGAGGGSGRLGDLDVSSVVGPVVFDTDGTTFDSRQLLTTYDPVTGEPDPIVVDDGIFEFASLTVRPGGVLRFEGSRPARVFARGRMVVQGTVDVSGESLPLLPAMPCDVTVTDPADEFYCAHLDPDVVGVDPETFTEDDARTYLMDQGLLETYFDGQLGGAAGAGGGSGGKGGDLPGYDASVMPSLSDSMGLNNLDGTIETDGEPGEGVPVPNSLQPMGTAGGGGEGIQWPQDLPTHADDITEDPNDPGLVIEDEGAFACGARQLPGAGGGGAGVTPGGPAVNGLLDPTAPGGGPSAPEAAGGDSAEIAAADGIETLSPFFGLLRGGSGGGGSGAGAPDSVPDGLLFNCINDDDKGAEEFPAIVDYQTARGAGGGGGGGAVQLQAGKRLVIDGVVDASGGDGGTSGSASAFSDRMNDTASAGSGAGGSILLQSEQVQLASVPGRLRIGGGASVRGAETQSDGGQGGLGRVRVESGLEPPGNLAFNSVKGRVTPTEEEAADFPGEPVLDDLLSVVHWTPTDPGDVDPTLIDLATDPQPELRSAAQSCWLKPEGSVFSTQFFEDEPGELGWDMEIFIAGLDQALSYRTPSPLLGGLSPEDFLALLGASPIEVRFQGARSLAPLEDPCDASVIGPDSPFSPPSVTPWVRHPAELNDINGSEELRPNWVRFQVVFDRNVTLPDFPTVPALDLFPGITSFFIRAKGE